VFWSKLRGFHTSGVLARKAILEAFPATTPIVWKITYSASWAVERLCASREPG